MAQNTKIEWCHSTGNLWHGCTKVHEGCDHCYAETLSKRWGRDIWGNDKPRMEIKSVWSDFIKFDRIAKEAGEIHRVFVGSMMDIFEKPMPVIDSTGKSKDYNTDYLRQKYFREIVPNTPNLMHLMLTKRPSNINKYIPEEWKINPPDNVMFGTSPVNHETAEKLIPQLQQVKGKKFLSIEPLLGSITLIGGKHFANGKEILFNLLEGISWVIVGGESGHGARPMHPDWVKSILKQCQYEKIPFLFKQWGEYSPGRSRDYPEENTWCTCVKLNGEISFWSGDDDTTYNHSQNYDEADYPMERVGKKAAGRELDGKTYTEFPK